MNDQPPSGETPVKPMTRSTARPHDRYFRAELTGRAEQAALATSLFPGIAGAIDPETFETVDGSFVDEELRERQTDVLLRTRVADRATLIYVLIEHQRTVDPLMAVRMHRYQARIWDRYLAEHSTNRVPAILPAVIYQGERPWTAPVDLRDTLDIDPDTAGAVEEYLPRQRYRLDDLTSVDLAALRARPLTAPLRLMLLLLKQAPGTNDVAGLVSSTAGDFAAVVAHPEGTRHLVAAFTYIRSVTDIPAGALTPIVDRLGPTAEEAWMTSAERLLAEGEARGEARGRVQGQAAVVIRQLTVRFGPLPDTIHDRITNATSHQLETWAEQILTATALNDIFT